MKEIKKNRRKNENPRSDKERNFVDNAKELEGDKKNRIKIENSRNDKELNFQTNAKELEGDKEKQEKE